MTTYKGSSIEASRSSSNPNGMQLTSQIVSVTAALTTSDTVRFGPFPAGIKPSHVKLVHGDLDTGSGTLVAKIGYSHADGSSGADDDLFGAGVTSLAAVSGVGGNDNAATTVTEIQKDWYLDIVPTTGANAMAATKTIFAVVFGQAVGAK